MLFYVILYARGESHQPEPAPDARSDERTSEEADSTRDNFALEIFGASWGQLVPSAALGPRFLSLGGHFGIIFGAFGGHFGSLGGSFGVFGPSWVVFSAPWLKEPPWFNYGSRILEAKVAQMDPQWVPK